MFYKMKCCLKAVAYKVSLIVNTKRTLQRESAHARGGLEMFGALLHDHDDRERERGSRKADLIKFDKEGGDRDRVEKCGRVERMFQTCMREKHRQNCRGVKLY